MHRITVTTIHVTKGRSLTVPVHTVTNFRQLNHVHMISQRIFAPHLHKTAS